MRPLFVCLMLATLLWACGNGGSIVKATPDQRDTQGQSDAQAVEMTPEPDGIAVELHQQEDTGLDLVFDLANDLPPTLGCEAGEGCFLDPCSENSDCQSGWCVDHLGDAVCTIACQEECSPGWSCQQVSGGGPDLLFVCVSQVANLCKPCGNSDNCKSVGGAEDVCVDYGEEGSFCGGACLSDEDCPWGFSCVEAVTVDGVSTQQCVADTGVCPCGARSVELGLWTPCAVSNEAGSCTGKRVCTDDGLSACDALTPVTEICNGVDDDCDDDVDEPATQGGDFVNLCDDGDECTADLCAGEAGCEHAALDGDECEDGNPCTVADLCVQGICLGTPVECDDDNPCTDDTCNEAGGCHFEPNFAGCDDGDPCSVGDSCLDGVCSGFSTACDCLQDADCQALEDGDLCNGTLVCDLSKLPYQCRVDSDTIVVCPEPEGGDAPCLTSSCDPLSGACGFAPDHQGWPCDDGDPCTLGDTCADGSCQAGEDVNCNDGNPCTADSCELGIGCVHGSLDGPCSDGDVCTVGDACVAGECVAGEGSLLCEDANPCTNDSCDAGLGCIFLAQDGGCDDGNACTINDHCQDKACLFDGVLDCNDGNLCTTDSCDPVQGCVHELNTAPCNDGNKCTTDDACHLGECLGSGMFECDDGNPCTADVCNPQAGCQQTPLAGECDDGNACTLADTCLAGKCVGTEVVSCEDNNLCTTDSCHPLDGCTYSFNSVPCSDGDLCTLEDHCVEGACTGGEELACDDDNPCTDDACSPQSGCIHLPNDAECTDLNECTVGDHCAGGECVITGMLTCDDGNICTNDNCDPIQGCITSANSQPCDDGDVCTDGDICTDGTCVPGNAVLCPDDGNPCTAELCDPADGCTFELVPDCCGNGVVEGGEECDDGNVADGDGCSAGCESGVGCSNQAEHQYQVVAGIWACLNDQLITTYQENNAMCAAGWTPATNKLVQGLPFPSLQQHQAMGVWHQQVAGNVTYIRTGQKRRGGCTPDAHGDIFINTNGSHYENGAGWHDLFNGGPSCLPDTYAANDITPNLAGVICVLGQYEPPQQ